METGPRLKVSSDRLVKLGIEPATPGLQGKRFIHYTTAAPLVWVVLGCILKSYSVTAKAATFISRHGSGSNYLVELIPCLSYANVRAFNGNTDRTFIYP